MARWRCLDPECEDDEHASGESDNPEKSLAVHRIFKHGQDGLGVHVRLTDS